ncbi:MAG TPA: hypothetical protein VMG40_10710 [Bryobacteraceae bacterium]|nr:hypothetical protein [Bryobacteraceae bacterium]
MKVLPILLLLAGQFWETKAPADWSEAELNQLLTDSPWAQMMPAPGPGGDAPPVQVMVATAAPIEKAQAEWDRRFTKKKPAPGPNLMKEEYLTWLEDNRATQIVLAIATPNKNNAFGDDREMRSMQDESVMIVGRKKYKITGYFPPAPGDPYLRLAFPREVRATDKKVTFDLYVPGVAIPYRSAEFSVKDMMLDGKLEM